MKQNKRALILIAPLFDEREFIYPYYRLLEEGYTVDVAGPKADTYKGKTDFSFEASLAFKGLKASDYDALLVPGGFAPDKIRTEQAALDLVRAFKEAGKPIAMICHAGWVAASAGIAKGVKLTSTKAIKDDLVHAGADWVDEEVVVDQRMVTSRGPDDMPAFMRAFIKEIEKDSKK